MATLKLVSTSLMTGGKAASLTQTITVSNARDNEMVVLPTATTLTIHEDAASLSPFEDFRYLRIRPSTDVTVETRTTDTTPEFHCSLIPAGSEWVLNSNVVYEATVDHQTSHITTASAVAKKIDRIQIYNGSGSDCTVRIDVMEV